LEVGDSWLVIGGKDEVASGEWLVARYTIFVAWVEPFALASDIDACRG